MLPEEGTLDMLHYALAEAQAVQRVGGGRQESNPEPPQRTNDQHQLQVGNTIRQPMQDGVTQPQHIVRRTVVSTRDLVHPGMPIAVDPHVSTADAEMLHLQNTLRQLRETTMQAQLQLTQVTAEREACIKRDRAVEDQKIEQARLAKLARVRLQKEIEAEQQQLVNLQQQTVLMTASQTSGATGGTTSQLASGSSTALVAVDTSAEMPVVTALAEKGVLPEGEYSPPKPPSDMSSTNIFTEGSSELKPQQQ